MFLFRIAILLLFVCIISSIIPVQLYAADHPSNIQVSRAIGYDLARKILEADYEILPERIVKGLQDAMTPGPVEMLSDEKDEILTAWKTYFAGNVTQSKPTIEKYSYAIGMDIGEKLSEIPYDFSVNDISESFLKTSSGNDIFTSEEASKIISRWRAILETQKEMLKAESIYQSGKDFLEENRQNKNIIVLDSGLQYRILQEGNGTTPLVTDEVTVHYRGRLIDGAIFESTYQHGQPATFILQRVIPGWREALTRMKAGSKWEIFIPAELAYGMEQKDPRIPAGSALIFELELLSVADRTDIIAKSREELQNNLLSGIQFMKDNKEKEGVVTLENGLQYKIIKEGKGPKPKIDDYVEAHYVGKLISGEVFHNTYAQNATTTFQIDKVIAGWRDVLPKMKEGAKWQLFVPPALAYGAKDDVLISPGSTLIFDLELLHILTDEETQTLVNEVLSSQPNN